MYTKIEQSSFNNKHHMSTNSILYNINGAGIIPMFLKQFTNIPEYVDGEESYTVRETEVNRLDKEKLAFHKKVREAFLYLHKTYPDRVRIIDASKDPDEVYKEALKEIHNVLRRR